MFRRRRGGMRGWETFLGDVEATDPEAALSSADRPTLAIDARVPHGRTGLALEKKDGRNPLGETRPSVLHLVHDLSFPMPAPVPRDLRGFADFAARMGLWVDDASPDTVTSAVLFAACQASVEVPPDVWSRWLPVITAWELTGNAKDPERSWPALASALAHRQFGDLGDAERRPTDQIAAAWRAVLPFLAEALRAGYDPGNVPPEATGPNLGKARAALSEERARYVRRAFASDIVQLSLPVENAPRRLLVDALLTQEAEFAGTLKAIARNDRTGSPLGQGFTLLMVERAALKIAAPGYWMTVSVDPRAGVHLRDLWVELERRETEAWEVAGRTRPPTHDGSRQIASVDAMGRRFHEPWYLDPTDTLVASPVRQTPEGEGDPSGGGSLLTAADVRRALFDVFDPLAGQDVYGEDPDENPGRPRPDPVRLIDLKEEGIAATGTGPRQKRVFTAWWPPETPLPHPKAADPLPPTVLRATAARTMGVPPERAYVDAPDLEDVEMVVFGNGLAVVTDRGVFLLDCGRGTPARIGAARELVVRQAQLAASLDAIQTEIGTRSTALADDLRQRGTTGGAIARQRQCATLNARLIDARGKLDVPLSTDEAGLRPLKDALMKRWNTAGRLRELVQEVEALDRNSRTAEELRLFRVGRWAAGLAIGLLAADALTTPLAEALGWDARLDGAERMVLFGIVFAVTFLLAGVAERVLRQSAGSQ